MGGRHVAGGGAGPRGGESRTEREQLEQQGGASGGAAALTAAKVTRPKLSQQIFPVSLQKYAPAHPRVLVAFFLGTICYQDAVSYYKAHFNASHDNQ